MCSIILHCSVHMLLSGLCGPVIRQSILLFDVFNDCHSGCIKPVSPRHSFQLVKRFHQKMQYALCVQMASLCPLLTLCQKLMAMQWQMLSRCQMKVVLAILSWMVRLTMHRHCSSSQMRCLWRMLVSLMRLCPAILTGKDISQGLPVSYSR